VNRAKLHQLAEDRIMDAAALLAAGRWSAAYYLSGYAIECGLKACIMFYAQNTGAIFQDKKYSERCSTHKFETLLVLAELDKSLDADAKANPALSSNWDIVKRWVETSRYQQKTQREAQMFYDAVASIPNGVLAWIRKHW
jgi:HEPN domain-containing protein